MRRQTKSLSQRKERRSSKIVGDIFFVITVVVLCALIFALNRGYHIKIAGYQVLRVISGSMEPFLEEGDVILVRSVDTRTLKEGDVITFTSEDPNLHGMYNTHRIYDIRVDEETNQEYYLTKGDANQNIDLYPVKPEKVAGVYQREVPGGIYLSKAINFLLDGKNYFLIVILPLLICLIGYMWQTFFYFVHPKDWD